MNDLTALAGWDVSNTTNMQGMFSYCTALEDLTGIDDWLVSSAEKPVSGGKGINTLFSGCTSLKDLSLISDWDITKVTNMNSLFSGCTALEDLTPIAGWDTSNVMKMAGVFTNCTSLKDQTPIAGWKTSKAQQMGSMFNGCTSLQKADFTQWDFSTAKTGINGKGQLFYFLKNVGSGDVVPAVKLNEYYTSVDGDTHLDMSATKLYIVGKHSISEITHNFSDPNNQTILYFEPCAVTVTANENGTYTLDTADNYPDPQAYYNAVARFSGTPAYDASKHYYKGGTNLVLTVTPKDAAYNSIRVIAAGDNSGLIATASGSTYTLSGLKDNYTVSLMISNLMGTSDTCGWSIDPTTGVLSIYPYDTANPNAMECTLEDIPDRGAYNMFASPWCSFQNHMNCYTNGTDYIDVRDLIKAFHIDEKHTVHTGEHAWYLFQYLKNITDWSGLARIDVSGSKTLAAMFAYSNLPDVSLLAGWKVSNVTDMQKMFYMCTDLQDLSGLADWNVSNVTTMESMFQSCFGLQDLDGLTDWNVSNVTTMKNMFKECRGLTNLSGLDKWSTKLGNVTTMESMFDGCKGLTDLSALGSWKLSYESGTDLYRMFASCHGLTNLDGLAGMDVSKVKTMKSMFLTCDHLTNLDGLSSWAEKVSNVTNMYYMFGYCSALTDLKGIKDWNVSGVTDMLGMFRSCSALEDATPLAGWGAKISKDAVIKQMFGKTSLKKADFTGWDFASRNKTLHSIGNNTDVDNLAIFLEDVDGAGVKMDEYYAKMGAKKLYVLGKHCLSDITTDLGSDQTTLMFEPCAVALTLTGNAAYTLPENTYSDPQAYYTAVAGFSGAPAYSDTNRYYTYGSTVDIKVTPAATYGVGAVIVTDEAGTSQTLSAVSENLYRLTNLSGNFSVTVKVVVNGGVSGTCSWSVNTATKVLSIKPNTSGATACTLADMGSASGNAPWTAYNDAAPITGVQIAAGNTVKTAASACGLFAKFTACTDWSGLTRMDVSGSTNLSNMFANSSSLTSLGNIAGWNVSNATNLSSMFTNCSGLTGLSDIAGWNTAKAANLSSMFENCSGLTGLSDIAGWNTAKAANLSSMFANCSGLTGLSDLSLWNTSAATNLSSMFANCSGLTSLSGISGWDVSSAADLSKMFTGCSGVKTLSALNSWDTANVTNLSSMFANCSGLTSLNGLADWNVSKATNLNSMFKADSNLKNLTAIGGWGEDLPDTANLGAMFSGCTAVKAADFTGWDFTTRGETNRSDFLNGVSGSGVKLDQYYANMGGSNLYVLGTHSLADLEKTDLTDSQTTLIFEPCAVSVTVNGTADTSITANTYSDPTPETFYTAVAAFRGAPMYSSNNRYYTSGSSSELTVTPASGYAVTSVIATDEDGKETSLSQPYSLDALNSNYTLEVTTALSNTSGTCSWSIDTGTQTLSIYPTDPSEAECTLGSMTDTSSVPWHAYNEGTGIKSVKIDASYTVKTADAAANMFADFSGCVDWSGLAQLDVSGTTNLSNMFKGCDSLGDDALTAVGGWNVSAVTNMSNMFNGCSTLTDLSGLESWNVSAVTNMSDMFKDCSGLTDLSGLGGWNVSAVTNMSEMFYSCRGLTNLRDLESWNVGAVTNTSNMFYNCRELTTLRGLEDWNVGAVTDMSSMFSSCVGLEDQSAINSWGEKLANPLDANHMFAYCSGLKTADFTDWDFTSTNCSDFFLDVSGTGVKLDQYFEDMNAEKLYVLGIHKLSEMSAIAGDVEDVLVFEPCAVEMTSAGSSTYTYTLLTDSNYSDPEDFYTAVAGFTDAPSYSVTNRYYTPDTVCEFKVTPAAGCTLKSVLATKEDGSTSSLTGTDNKYQLDAISGNVTISVTTGTGSADAGDSGSCSWSIDSNNVLTIKPAAAGAMECTLSGTAGSVDNVPWHEYNEGTKIKGVKIADGYTVKTAQDASHLFEDLTECTDWSGLENLDVSGTSNMEEMFKNCDKLTNMSVLDGWDVSEVTNMDSMFEGSDGLTSLSGIEDWDVSGVADLEGMFKDCDNLKDVTDINSWGEKFDAPSNTSAKEMFSGCDNLQTADFTDWDFSVMGNANLDDFLQGVDGAGVKLDGYYEEMGAEKLYLLGIHSTDDLNPTLPESQSILVFEPCAIEVPEGGNVDFEFTPDGTYDNPSGFYAAVAGFKDAPELSDDYRYFEPGDDPVIKITPKEGFTLQSVIATDEDGNPVPLLSSVDGTYSITDIPGNVTISVTTLTGGADAGDSGSCSWSIDSNNILTITPATAGATECTLGSTGGDETNVPWYEYNKSTKIKGVKVDEGITVKTADDASHLFENFTECTDWSGLEQMDVSGTTNMDSMFENCDKLKDLSVLEDWDVSGVTSMEEMFHDCDGVTTLSALEDWDVSNVEDMDSMFENCDTLKDLSGLEGWDVDKVTDLEGMFKDDTALEDVTDLNSWGEKFDDPSHTNVKEMFSGDTGIDTADFSGWDFKEIGGTNREDFLEGVGSDGNVGIKLDSYYEDMGGENLYLPGKHKLSELSGTDLDPASQDILTFEPCAIEVPTGINVDYVFTPDGTYSDPQTFYTAVDGFEDAPEYSDDYRYFNPDDDPVIKITPKAGYTVKSVIATDEDGNPITLTPGADGTYTLNNIPENVTLSVTTVKDDGTSGTSGSCSWSIENNILTIKPAAETATECTLSGTAGDGSNVPWQNKSTSITGVQIADGFTVKTADDASHLFEGFSVCTDWSGLANLDVSGTTNMNSMFAGSGGLSSLNKLQKWDVSKVTSMESMFMGCTGLTGLSGLKNWDVSQVTNMKSMFAGSFDTALTKLSGLEAWNTAKVTDLSCMFFGCTSLQDVTAVNSWGAKFTDSANTNAAEMFSGCTGVKTADFTGWDFTEMGSMNLENFLEGVNGAGVKLNQYYTNMKAAKLYVLGKHSLSDITTDLGSDQTTLVFEPCAVKLPSGGNGTYELTDSTYTNPSDFYAAVAGFEDAPSYDSQNYRYYNPDDDPVLTITPAAGDSIKTVVATGENGTTSTLTPDSEGKYPLTDIKGNVTLTVTTITGGTNAGTSGTCKWSIDSSSVLTISPASAGATECTLSSTGGDQTNVPWYDYNKNTKIKGVKIASGNTVKTAEDASHLFEDFTECTDWSGLQQLDVSGTTDMDSMFENCDKMTNLSELGDWDVSGVTSMEEMFHDCDGLTTLSGLENWNVYNVTDMDSMFENCDKLETLSGLEKWNVTKVTDLEGMFKDSTALKDVTDINSWGTKFTDPTQTNAAEMFSGCTGLKTADFTDWDFTDMGSANRNNFLDNVTGAGVKLDQYYDDMGAEKLYVLGKHTLSEITGAGSECQSKLVLEPCAVSGTSSPNSTYTIVTDNTYSDPQSFYTAVAGFDDAPTYSADTRYFNSGASIELTVAPAAGYTVKSVVAKNETGTQTVLTESAGKYQLSGVTGNVTISVNTVNGDGKSGDSGSCSWSIDSNNILTITPATAGATECTLGSTGGDETNVPWHSESTTIKGVQIDDTITVKTADDASHLFEDFTECTDWSGLENLDVSGTTNMDSMFENCDKLTDLSGLVNLWDVSGVTDMEEMFHDCDGMTTLSGLEDWDVSNVEDMDSMFENCDSLKDLSGLKDWDVDKVTDLEGMFKDDTALEEVTDLNSWGEKFDDPSHTNVKEMFSGDTGIDTADFSGWDFQEMGGTNREDFLEGVGSDGNVGVKLDSYYEDMGGENLYLLGTHDLDDLTGTDLNPSTQDILVFEPCAIEVPTGINVDYEFTPDGSYSDPQTFYTAVDGFEDAPDYPDGNKRYFKADDNPVIKITPKAGYTVKSVIATDEDGNPITLTPGADGTYALNNIPENVTISVTTVKDDGKSGTSGSCNWSIDSNNILTITPAAAGETECTLGSTGGSEDNVPWHSESTNISGVQIATGNTVKTGDDASHLFEDFSQCSDWSGLENLDVSGTTNMNSMFDNCDKLTDLSSLEDWDVSGVTSMEEMFRDCDGLTTLNGLDDWNVSSVTNMDSMFENCDKLNDLNSLEGWDVSKVTDLEGMFKDDTALKDLTGLNSWGEEFDDPSQTNAAEMFSGCTGVKTADFSDWDFTEMGSTNRTNFLDSVSNAGVKLDQYYDDMGADKLYVLGKHKLSEITGAGSECQDKLVLEPCAVKLPSGGNGTYTLTDSTYTDPSAYYAAVAGLEDAPSYDSVNYRYYNPDDDPVLTVTPGAGDSIKTVVATGENGTTSTLTPDSEGKYPLTDITGNVTLSVTTITGGTNAGTSGTCKWSIDSSSVLTISPASAGATECTLSSTGGDQTNVPWYDYNKNTKIKGVKIASGNTVKTAEDASHLFEDFTECTDWSGLQQLDVSGTTNMGSMFENCDKMTNLSELGGWDVSGVTSMEEMFHDCDGLTTLSGLENWNVTHVTNMDSMFENCDKLETLSGLEKWNVINATDLEGMFKDSTALTDVTDINSWGEKFNAPANTNAAEMFSGCTGLKTADFTDWNFTDMGSTNRTNFLDNVTGAGVKLDQYYDDMGAEKLYVLGKHTLSEITGAGSECQGKLLLEPCAVSGTNSPNSAYTLITDSTYTNPSAFYDAVAGFDDAPAYSADARYFNPGDSCDLTVTPAADYKIKSVVSKDEAGTQTVLTNTDGKYTVSGITGNVSVTVTTEKGGANTGTFGSCTWSIDASTRVLTLKPAASGAKECTLGSTSGSASNVPWYEYNRSVKIKGVSIASDITVKTAGDASHLFDNLSGCTDWSALARLDVSGTTNMDQMFNNCDGLSDLSSLASWNVSTVTSMQGMFKDCSGLEDQTDINSWGAKLSKTANASQMFSGCTGLKTADFTDWNFTNMTRDEFFKDVNGAGVKLNQYYTNMDAVKLYVFGKHSVDELTGKDATSGNVLVFEPCAISVKSTGSSSNNLLTANTHTEPQAFYTAVAGFSDAPKYSADNRYYTVGSSCELEVVPPTAAYRVKSVTAEGEDGKSTTLSPDANGHYWLKALTGNVSITVLTEKDKSSGISGSCSWSIDARTNVLTIKPTAADASACTLGNTTDANSVPWAAYNSETPITGVQIASGCTVKTGTSAAYLFSGLSSCTDWSGLAQLDVSGTSDAQFMFKNCYELKDLSALSSWNVSKITNMISMFINCSALEDLTSISGWGAQLSDTASVTAMFCGCTGVATADFSGWDFDTLGSANRNGFLNGVNGAGVKLDQYYSDMGPAKLYVLGKHQLADLSGKTDLTDGQTTLVFEPCAVEMTKSGNGTYTLVTENTYTDPEDFYTAVAGFTDAPVYSGTSRYYTPNTTCELTITPAAGDTVNSVIAVYEDGTSGTLTPVTEGHYSLSVSSNVDIAVTTGSTNAGTSGSCSWSIENNILTIKPASVTATECTLSGTAGDGSNVPWQNKSTSITGVQIADGFTVKTAEDASHLFEGFSACTDWSGLNNLDVSGTTNMNSMFAGSGGLSSLNKLQKWDVSKVTSMESMFMGCTGLTGLSGLKNWDVSQVTNMKSMFAGSFDTAFTKLSGLEAWNTAKVTDLSWMFFGCTSLQDVTAVNSWGAKFTDPANTNAAEMFSGCTGMKTADFTDWNFETMGSSSTDYRNDFLTGVDGAGVKLNQYYDNMGADKLYILSKYKLEDLTATDLTAGQTKLVFEPCAIAVTSGANSTYTLSDSDYTDAESFYTAVAGFTDAPTYSANNRYYSAGSSCTLTVTPAADYKVKSVIATDNNNKPLTLNPVSEGTYLLSNLTGSLSVAVTTVSNNANGGDFGTCGWSIDSNNVLTISPSVSGAAECTLGSTMGSVSNVPWNEYNQSTKITGVKVASGCTVKTADDASHLFDNLSGCTDWSGLSQLDVSGTKNMESMFAGCAGLTDLSGMNSWNVSNVTNMKSMFADCDGLTGLSGLGGWNVSNATSMESMFSDSDQLNDVSALAGWNVSSVTNMKSMFVSCDSLQNVSGLGGWSVSGVKTMEAMFKDCAALANLSEFNGWGTKVSDNVNAAELFSGCAGVKTADLSDWDFSALSSANRTGLLSGISGAGVKLDQYYTDMGASNLYVLGKHELADIAGKTDLTEGQTILKFEPCVVAVVNSGNNTYTLNTANTYPDPVSFYAAVAGFDDAPVYSADNRYYTPGTSCTMDFSSPVAGYQIQSVTITGEDGIPMPLLPDAQGHYALESLKGNYSVTAASAINGESGSCSWSIDTASHALSIKPTAAGATECTLDNTEPLAGGVSNAPWYAYNTDIAPITALKIDGSYTVHTADSAAFMFSGLGSCTDWSGLARLDVSGTTDMNNMFTNCGGLKDLSLLENWNISNVTSMGSMFKNCSGLTNLSALNSWGTKITGTSVDEMFGGCVNVHTADFSNWDFSALSSAKRSGFLNNVGSSTAAGVKLGQYYGEMGASKLYVLGAHSLSDLKEGSNAGSTTLVFEPCSVTLKENGAVAYSNISANTYTAADAQEFYAAVKNINGAPTYDANKHYYTPGSSFELTILPAAAGYEIKSVVITYEDGTTNTLNPSADGHYNLGTLTGNISVSVTLEENSAVSGTYGSCTWSISSSHVLSIKPTAAGASDCTLADTQYLPGNVPNVPWAAYNNVTAPITGLRIDGTYTVNTAASAAYLFSGLSNCSDWSGLTRLNVSGTTNLKGMFKNCGKLENLSDISGWGATVSANAANVSEMFSGCSGLKTADFGSWNFETLGSTNRSGFLNGVSGAGVKLNQYYADMGAQKLYVLGKHQLSKITTDLTDAQTTLVFEPCAVSVKMNKTGIYNLVLDNTYPDPAAFYAAVAGFKDAPQYSEFNRYYTPGSSCELVVTPPSDGYIIKSVIAIDEAGNKTVLTRDETTGRYRLDAITGNYSIEVTFEGLPAAVIFDLDNGEDHISAELKLQLQSIRVGDSFILPGVSEVTKPDYTLDGWCDDGDNEKEYNPGDEYTVNAVSVTLKAIYKNAVMSYTITYEEGNAEGGSVPAPQVNIPVDTTINLRGNDGGLSKTGHEFYCWTDGLKWYLPYSDFMMPDHDVILWPVFTEIINRDPLPEDEIGTYGFNEDGTKFYIQFHTYEICMNYMGDDNLCRNTSANLFN